MVDNYIADKIPFSDAKVVTALCIDSANKYELMKDCDIGCDWIYQYVVPVILEKLGDKRAATILCESLLWACLGPDGQNIPTYQSSRG